MICSGRRDAFALKLTFFPNQLEGRIDYRWLSGLESIHFQVGLLLCKVINSFRTKVKVDCIPDVEPSRGIVV